MKLRIKNTELTLQVISWLQIIGGLTGLYVVAILMLQTGTINGGLLLIFLTGLSLFLYSIYCGISLLIRKDKRIGIILSIINQTLQLIQWSLFGYGLTYSSGAEIAMGFQGTTFKLNLTAIVSNFNMSLNTEPVFLLKLNIFAILVIYALVDILYEIKKEKFNKTVIEELNFV